MSKEIEMYPLHITQRNDLKNIMTKEVADTLKKHHAAVTEESKDFMKYLATLLFRTDEDRLACYNELKDKIDVVLDNEIAMIDEKNIK